MSSSLFSVPYNDDFSLLERIVEIRNLNGNKIEEVYFSGPREYFGSAREMPEISIDKIIKIIKFCYDNGIKTNLLLNSSCEGIDWYSPLNISKVLKLIEILHIENGLDGITVANPLFIQKIRKEFPKLEITASVLAQIDSVQRAMFFKRFGCDVITPDRDINRNLELLKEIKEIGCELKLMVNEGCLFKCPYRIFHYNFTSHDSKELNRDINRDIFTDNCSLIFKIDPSQILKSCWIRPEDVPKYKKITNRFKIAGRQIKDTQKILKIIKGYMNFSYEGNLLDLFEAGISGFKNRFNVFIDNKNIGDNFFQKVTSCDKNCFGCKFCGELAKKVIKIKT